MTNMLSRYGQLGLSARYLNSQQLAMDALSEQAKSRLGDWHSLTSMILAGAAGKLISASLPVLGRGVWAASVAGESFVFESTQCLLSSNFSQENFFHSTQNHFINFAMMHLLSPLGARFNPVLQFGMESGAMVLGQNVVSYFEGTTSSKSLSEQFLDASVFAIQNRVSMAGLHALTGGCLQIWEASMELFGSRDVVLNPLFDFDARSEILSMAATKEETALAKRQHREHQTRLMADEDHGDYFHVLEEPLLVSHSWRDMWTLMRIRRHQSSSNGSKITILGVSIFIRDESGRVLLTYDRRDTKGIGRIPSESAELIDQSIAEVAERGVFEELGTSARVVCRIARVPVQFTLLGSPRKRMDYYLLEARLNRPIELPLDGEIARVEYVDPDRDFYFTPEGMYPGINNTMNEILRGYLQR